VSRLIRVIARIGYVCAERQSQVGEAVDDGICPGSGEVFAFAGFVGVADAPDVGEAGGLGRR
jgi:hypothetical protein